MPRSSVTYQLHPGGSSLRNYLQSCWQHLGLIWLFARRDWQIKYAQTWLGISWTLLQPMASVLLYALVFSSLFGPIAQGKQYLVQLCTGVVGWSLFHYVAQQSSAALHQQQALLKKVAFPRLLLLLSKAYTGLLDFTLAFVVLCVFLCLQGTWPTWHYVALPIAVGMFLVQGLCIGVWFSALSIVHRDLMHALPWLLHGLLWLSPVFYTTLQLQGNITTWIQLNPLTEALTWFRWSLMGGTIALPPYLFLRTAGTIICLCVGIVVLVRTENRLSDEG